MIGTKKKARRNLAKHKVSFEEGETIFDDPFLVTYPDELHSDTEDRLISVGMSKKERVLLVVHVEKRHYLKEDYMKKANKLEDYDDGMLPEYDFTGKKGVRGKYYRGRQQGY